MHRLSLVILCGVFFTGYANAQQGVAIQWKDDKAESILVNKSLLKHYSPDPDSVSFFNVRVANEHTNIIGKTVLAKEGVLFTPTWPFNRGMQYDIYWKDELIGQITIPQKTGEESVITLYPTADKLPENILKFYFVFSKPMTENNWERYVHILNDNNDTLQVLLAMKPELWNSDHTMRTCWVDPGRIKRELLLQQELGKPLVAGNNYRLLILPGWKDADGIATTKSYTSKFTTTQADRTKPEVKNWSIQKPKSSTTDPLIINFKESMDYAVALRGIDIERDEKYIKGKIMLQNEETIWTFTPDEPWKRGTYVLKIDPLIEDLAGNNLERLFDNDLQQNDSALSLKSKTLSIDFKID